MPKGSPPQEAALSPPRRVSFPTQRHKSAFMNSNDLITVDPEILGGAPVFKGTRVPVKTLFEYLENDYSVGEFLDCFPSVSRGLVNKVLERSEQALLSPAAY